MHGECAQAVVQSSQNALLGQSPLEVGAAGGKYPQIDGNACPRNSPALRNSSFCKTFSSWYCSPARKCGDFVQEDRAFFACRELSQTGRVSIGEGSAFVPKHFGFDTVSGISTQFTRWSLNPERTENL